MIELDWKISNLAICLTAASLGGLKVGFDLGVLNPCLKYVSEDLSLAAYQEGLIMVLLIVSATFGALASGRIADGVGMISAQALAAIFGGAGSAISAAAFGPSGVWVMALGRFISGLGVHHLNNHHVAAFVTPIAQSPLDSQESCTKVVHEYPGGCYR